MPKIIQLSTHVANLIAAGEVVERPASVVKELLENAVDAGASKVTVEIRDGGMTFLRVTDDGCGMSPEDAATAFLRHATSKLRTAEDLSAISTCGFRGEALAAIASVSRIDLLTKTAGAVSGTSLRLEAGAIVERGDAGCPEGTTIIVRDLFYNTPARMKFMKSDTVEGGKVTAAVQLQALAHPNVAFTMLRDGKQVLSTPGTGGLQAAVYCIYGRECAKMAQVDSRWEGYSLTGFVSRPTDSRPSRNMQTFFVNGRPVKSKLLIAALEEAYRNQIMAGKFPTCVLHLNLPANAVDVNVHPAKTEVKFLSEKAVFDCVHYGVLGALNKQQDRPQVQFKQPPRSVEAAQSAGGVPHAPQPPAAAAPLRGEPKPFFRTMTTEEFKHFSTAIKDAPQPQPAAAAATVKAMKQPAALPLQQQVILPKAEIRPAPAAPQTAPEPAPMEEAQTAIVMPEVTAWRIAGELWNSYILVEQGEDAFLIDKHAAHERILFDKLKAKEETVSSQMLLTPLRIRLQPDSVAVLMNSRSLLEKLGFEIDQFGDNTVLVRQIPMDLSSDTAAEAVEELAQNLAGGRQENGSSLRDELLHTIACKAAIKAGWHTDPRELEVLARQVMERQELKHCPHGRPICIKLSKKQLERQFKRT